MLKAVFVAVAIVVVLEPISVSAAPNPALCGQLRKIFDICENYQVKHHLPVSPLRISMESAEEGRLRVVGAPRTAWREARRQRGKQRRC
jgi:hypothetical protein